MVVVLAASPRTASSSYSKKGACLHGDDCPTGACTTTIPCIMFSKTLLSAQNYTMVAAPLAFLSPSSRQAERQPGQGRMMMMMMRCGD